MIDGLLLATDFSQRSELALDRAVQLTTGAADRIGFLHVIDPDVSIALTRGEESATPPIADELLNARLAPGAARPDILIRKGDPHEEIVGAAMARDDDLIVMGAPRQRGFLGNLRGTTLERVIRASTLPVLSVRRAANGSYRRVLVMTDLSDSSAFAVQMAQRLGVMKGARVTIVHALWPPTPQMVGHGKNNDESTQKAIAAEKNTAINEIRAELRRLKLDSAQSNVIVMEGAPQTVIRRVLEDNPADLVVLGTRGRSGVLRFILGSIAEDLLNWLPVDVLAVPPALES